MNRPKVRLLVAWACLLGGLIASSFSVAHAQYADFKRGTSLEHWREGRIAKASAALIDDGGIVVIASVPEPRWSKHLILWRLRADGSTAWSRTWDVDAQSPLKVVVAPDGSLIIAGAFHDKVKFGTGELVSAGSADIFLGKLDRNGNHVWSRSFGAAGDDINYQALVDENGNITLAGRHSGVDFGGGLVEAPGLFRATFGPDGTYLSSKSFAWSIAFATINDMSVNAAGDLYAIGGAYFPIIGSNASTSDIVMVGFDGDGSVRLSQRFGDKFWDSGYGIVQTAEGDLLTTGIVADKVSLGGPVLDASWIGDVFVARYSADGEHQWSRVNESSEYHSSECTAIALHPAGGFVVTGSFINSLQFDEASLFARSRSLLMLRFDSDGRFLWMGKGTEDARVLSIAGRPDGNTVVVGTINSNIPFCTGDVVKTANARGFVAEFSDEPHFDNQAPNVPAHPAYDGATITWDASTDPEGAAVRYQVDEKVSPPWIEKRTIVAGTSMPLNAADTRNHFVYITAFDCFEHASEETDRIEIHPSLTAPLAPGDVHFEGDSLVWTTPTDADVVGVAVDGTNTWMSTDTLRLVMTMTPGLNVKNLSFRTYYVRARDSSGNWGDRVIIGDAVPPPVPTGFAYAIPKLTWDASKDVGFSHFEVFASKSPDFTNEKVLLERTRKNEFEVPLESRNSYYHLVQVDGSGNTSAPTTVVGRGGSRPARPRALAYRAGRLSWSAADDDDIDRYDIFASATESSEGPRALVGATSDLEFDVSELDHHWYYVVAVDQADQESEASVVSAITGRAPSFTLSLGVLSNPFRGGTTLQYSLPKEGRVKIDVYDLRGGHVATLVNGIKARGSYYVDWSGESENRGAVPSGVYFARLQFGRQERAAKLVVLR